MTIHVPAPRAVSLLALAALIAVGPARPQAQGTPGAERTAERIVVDFAAVDGQGHPIADLKPSEVSIRVDNRTRTIRSLQFVALAREPRTDAAGTPMPPPFGSNDAAAEGRTFYLVIDEDSLRAGRERPLRDAVTRFVASLSPGDRVALTTVPYGGVRVPLTSDHTRIRTAITTIVGRGAADESGSDFACRTRTTLEALGGLLDHLGASETPRTVIFLSSGLAGPRRDSAPMRAPGRCELTVDMFRQVGSLAGAARIGFYMVLPEDVAVRPRAERPENIAGVGFDGSDNPFEGLENLAGVTGAHRMYLTNLPETALGRIARETSGYYVATLTPERSDRTGRTHQLNVRVARPHANVRSRPEITFEKDDPARPAPSVREMVLSGRVYSELPLRATAFASKEDEGGNLKVVALIESPDARAQIATLGAVLYNDEGRPVAHWTGSGTDIRGSPVMAGMLAPPGVYHVRVAAIDDLGRGGTADAEVNATLTPAGPLQLSSLVLGLSRQGTFTPKLQFGAEPVAIAYVEIYGGAPGMGVTAGLEVAATLNGPALLTVPLALSQGDRRHLATGAVPIGALPDGDYAVRAVIGVEGQAAGRVVRTLRKAAK